ncbi:MAG TPA: DUF2804 domain-containing protein [Pseudomonadales bacterium]|nr:DUF2804 domain-containing protein [Pseudomonadales bacterium]
MPEKLILSDGNPRFGLFDHPVSEINRQAFDYKTVLDKPASHLAKYFHYNQFHFIGLISEELIVGLAIVDLKLVSNAFAYFYSVKEKKFVEHSFLQPLAMQTRFDNKPDNGMTHFRKGENQFYISATDSPRSRHIKLNLKSGDYLEVSLNEPTDFKPLALCTRTGYNGWTYTQKAAALDVEGMLSWDQKQYVLQSPAMLGSYDWSCGYMRSETFWNWGSLSDRLSDGRRIGLNIAAGTNETGFTENLFWLDGKQNKLDTIDFNFDRNNIFLPWKMRSFDGKLNLEFRPEGIRKEKINAVLLASNFKQLFGRYYGELRTDAGEIIQLTGQLGFAEDHYAKW